MKYTKILMLFGICVFLGTSCKKEEPPAATCSDGMLNQSETKVDCGGPCPACPPTVAPCNSTNTDNKMTTGTSSSFTFNFTSVSCGNSSGQYQIQANGSQGTMYINFDSEPTVTKTYSVTNTPMGMDADEVNLDIRVTFGVTMLSKSSGSVFVEVSGGVITAEFCDIECLDANMSTHTATGRVACP